VSVSPTVELFQGLAGERWVLQYYDVGLSCRVTATRASGYFNG